jgi:hypothetical protein
MLSKDIGVSYFTAWLMLHKLREAMAQRDSAYILEGIIEMDGAFFGAPTEGGKRDRGTEKTPAIITSVIDLTGVNLKGRYLADCSMPVSMLTQ